MKVRYRITGRDGGLLFHAMSDNQEAMGAKLLSEPDCPEYETQYAVLNEGDIRAMARHDYIDTRSFHSPGSRLEFAGRVLVNTEVGTRMIPYLQSESPYFETGAEDWMLDDRPMPILREMERLHPMAVARGDPSDYAIRTCQAIAAQAGGYTDCNQWRGILREARSDPAAAALVESTRSLRILEALEGFRRSAEPKELITGLAIRLCQHHTAYASGMENPHTWREQLRHNQLREMEPLFTFDWQAGCLNDNIAAWCKENGVDYQYDHAMQMELEIDGQWGRCETMELDGRQAVYLIPLEPELGQCLDTEEIHPTMSL